MDDAGRVAAQDISRNTLIFLAFVVIAAGLFTLNGRRKMPASPQKLAHAYDVSCTFVRRQLGPVDIPSRGGNAATSSRQLEDGNYRTTGTATRPGAETGRSWECVVHSEGNEGGQGHWKLIYLHSGDYTFGSEP